MAWKPKTVVGKILKGAVVAGGSILGLSTGVGVLSSVIKGTGVIAGAATGIKSAKGLIDKVATSAQNFISGTTKEERVQIQEVKQQARFARDKVEQVTRLMRAGLSQAAALAKVGISEYEYEGSTEPTDITTDTKASALFMEGKELETIPANNKTLIYAGLGILALFMLPKLFKR